MRKEDLKDGMILEMRNEFERVYINNRLYTIAEFKLREIKSRLDYKISYLSQVMEEIE